MYKKLHKGVLQRFIGILSMNRVVNMYDACDIWI